MKTHNDNHTQIANRESNIDRGEDKMSLLKTFNSKRLKKSCSVFLSSIVILSILSLANSSFAFPARVASDRLFINSSQPKPFLRYSKLEIISCNRTYCSVKGYFQGNRLFRSFTGRAKRSDLCDDPGEPKDFLQTCPRERHGDETD